MRCAASSSRCCRWSRPGRRMSASPPITSSSRFATTSGPATRPARASTTPSWPSSPFSKPPSWPWAWSSGRWSSSRPTTRWHRRPRWPSDDRRCRAGPHLHPRQGPRPVRLGSARGPTRPAQGRHHRRGGGPGPLRHRARVDPRLARPRGDSADGFPGTRGLGQAVGVEGPRALRAPRGDPALGVGLGPGPASGRAQRPQVGRPTGVGDGRRACCSGTWRPCASIAPCWRRSTTWPGRAPPRTSRTSPASCATRPWPSAPLALGVPTMTPTDDRRRRTNDAAVPGRVPVGNRHLVPSDRGRQHQQRLVAMGAQPRVGMRGVERRRL